MTRQIRSFEDGALEGGSQRLHDMLREMARSVTFPAGHSIFRQGDAGDAIYAIVEGEVEINLFSKAGRKIVLNVLTPGMVFGEIALFDNGPRTAGATAKSDILLACVQRSQLTEALKTSPDLAADLLQLAGQRFRAVIRQFEDLSFLPLEIRVARQILQLAAPSSAEPPTIDISQADLAERVGATREAVSKTLSLWKQQGLVRMGRGWIRIEDHAGLSDLARAGI